MKQCKNSQGCKSGICFKKRCIPTNCTIQSDCGQGNKCKSDKCIIGCHETNKWNTGCPQDKECIEDFCLLPGN